MSLGPRAPAIVRALVLAAPAAWACGPSPSTSPSPEAEARPHEAGGIVFWSKGSAASLDSGSTRHASCQGTPAADAWQEAALLGADFRAVGQEPGWSLEVAEGQWVRYAGDYGATRFFAPLTVAPAPAPGTVAYHARAGQRTLEAEVREAPCRDAMSGESFTHAVTVRLDSDTVTGCGRRTGPSSLTGTIWQLAELEGRPALPGSRGQPPFLLLSADMKASGSGGCNNFGGSFTREGDALAFGRLASTLMGCGDTSVSRQEQDFFRALAQVSRARLAGGELILYAGDRPVARFRAGQEPQPAGPP